jgi:hypothetical protein
MILNCRPEDIQLRPLEEVKYVIDEIFTRGIPIQLLNNDRVSCRHYHLGLYGMEKLDSFRHLAAKL